MPNSSRRWSLAKVNTANLFLSRNARWFQGNIRKWAGRGSMTAREKCTKVDTPAFLWPDTQGFEHISIKIFPSWIPRSSRTLITRAFWDARSIQSWRRKVLPPYSFILMTGRAGSCETLPPQYTALYPHIPDRLYQLRLSLWPFRHWGACVTSRRIAFQYVQDSIKSHTIRVRGDVTSRGLAALHAHTHWSVAVTWYMVWHQILGLQPLHL